MKIRYIALPLVAMCACGEIPDASIQYHLTKTSLRLEVTRTVKCSIVSSTVDKKQVAPTDPDNFVIVTTTVTPRLVNSADTDSAPGSIDLSEIRGTFTDPDFKVAFYPDGRLKSVNSTQTGTAKQILDSTLTLAATVAGKRAGDGTNDAVDACEYIFRHSKEEKGQLSLTYSGSVVARVGTHKSLVPSETSLVFHRQLQSLGQINDLHVSIGANDIQALKKPLIDNEPGTTQSLTARQLSKVKLSLHEAGGPELWYGTVLMALPNNEYEVPLPDRPAFGTAKFEVAFDDAGAIQALNYAATSGTNDAIDLANSVIDEAQGSTTSEQAAALSAETNLIIQRQRLANCQADPVNCK